MLADTPRHYPGTPQHQVILRTIVAYYETDPRILAVAVFGSLGRRNCWQSRPTRSVTDVGYV